MTLNSIRRRLCFSMDFHHLTFGSSCRRLKKFAIVSSFFSSCSFVTSTVTRSHRRSAFVMTSCYDPLASIRGVRRSARLSQKRLIHDLKGTSSTPEDPAAIRPKKNASDKKYVETKRPKSTQSKQKKNKIPTRSRNFQKEVGKSNKSVTKANQSSKIVTPSIEDLENIDCLPRTREFQLKKAHDNPSTALTIIGVDEAGRGPLAGPVVVAAAICPTDISGVVDSKKITKEEEREKIYEEIVSSPGVKYAVAVISAQRIDEINILQATF
ncbi:hypothetical protein ACHAXS_005559 [Conticribra weissflogii]